MVRAAKMSCIVVFLVCVIAAEVAGQETVAGQKPPQKKGRQSLWTRDSLTGTWFGYGEELQQKGLSVGLGMTHVYQHNLHGGREQGVGGYAGSYDLELGVDTGRAFDIHGGRIYMLGEGSTVSSAGVDARAVGSLFGINDDMGGERTLDITELWYQHEFADGALRVRVGKQDLTHGFTCNGRPVGFDLNAYAADETTQFLNSSLVNNPVIPFPEFGLGITAYAEPVDGWYVTLGGADADADVRRPGFETTFSGDSDFFYIGETGLATSLPSERGELPGTYRVGTWHQHKRRAYLDKSGQDPENTGFYASFDQLLWRENAGDGTPQGLGVFGRTGWADPDVSETETFASAGLHYRGLVPGRDRDVLGIGVSHGEVSEQGTFTADYERAAEVYYNAAAAPWLHVTPHLQWIGDPGAAEQADDALLLGLRVQMNF